MFGAPYKWTIKFLKDMLIKVFSKMDLKFRLEKILGLEGVLSCIKMCKSENINPNWYKRARIEFCQWKPIGIYVLGIHICFRNLYSFNKDFNV